MRFLDRAGEIHQSGTMTVTYFRMLRTQLREGGVSSEIEDALKMLTEHTDRLFEALCGDEDIRIAELEQTLAELRAE